MKKILFSILCVLAVSDTFAQQFSGYIFRTGFNVTSTSITNLTYKDQEIFLPSGTVTGLVNLEGGQATTIAIPVGVEVFAKHLYFSTEMSFGLRGSVQPKGNYNKSIMRDGIFELRLAFGGYFNENMAVMGGFHYKYQLLNSPNFVGTSNTTGGNSGIIKASSALDGGTTGGNQFNTNIFNDRIGGHMPGLNVNFFYSPNERVMVRGTYLASYIVPPGQFPTKGIGHQIEGSICYVTSEDSDERFGVIFTGGFQSRNMWATSAIDVQTNVQKYNLPRAGTNSLFANLSLILPGKILNGIGRVASYSMFVF